MPTYTVKTARKLKDVPDNGYGPKQDIELILNGPDGEVTCSWFTSAQTQVPADGSQIEGDITPSPYGLKFKKARGGFGGGGKGGAPKSPEERAAIAASVALREGREAVEQAATFGIARPTTLEEHAALWKRYSEFAYAFIDAKTREKPA